MVIFCTAGGRVCFFGHRYGGSIKKKIIFLTLQIKKEQHVRYTDIEKYFRQRLTTLQQQMVIYFSHIEQDIFLLSERLW